MNLPILLKNNTLKNQGKSEHKVGLPGAGNFQILLIIPT